MSLGAEGPMPITAAPSQRRLAACVSHSPGMARDLEKTQGREFRDGLEQIRAAVGAFDPSVVVLFGTDHWRAFPENVPAVAVVQEAEGIGDLGSPTGSYRIPAELAVGTAGRLLASGIDCALVRRGRLDHGFGQTAADVLGGLDRYPVIPVFLNCALPPLMSCTRAVEIGRAVRDAVGDEERVAFIASGGLSHDPPSLALDAYGSDDVARRQRNVAGSAEAARRIRPDLDVRFLEGLAGDDDAWVQDLEQWYLPDAGAGGNEIRTWLACWGAAGGNLHRVAYQAVPEWITGMGAVSSTLAAASR